MNVEAELELGLLTPRPEDSTSSLRTDDNTPSPRPDENTPSPRPGDKTVSNRLRCLIYVQCPGRVGGAFRAAARACTGGACSVAPY